MKFKIYFLFFKNIKISTLSQRGAMRNGSNLMKTKRHKGKNSNKRRLSEWGIRLTARVYDKRFLLMERMNLRFCENMSYLCFISSSLRYVFRNLPTNRANDTALRHWPITWITCCSTSDTIRIGFASSSHDPLATAHKSTATVHHTTENRAMFSTLFLFVDLSNCCGIWMEVRSICIHQLLII